MQGYIEDRVIRVSQDMIKSGKTIRQIASEQGVSKSTVHKDLSTRLKLVKPELVPMINKIMSEHFTTKHINGGMATRNKFKTYAEN